MTDDEGRPRSFEESARAIADEIRRSIERASQVDPDEIARAVGVDPDRVREWLDNAGEWLSSQLEGAVAGPGGGMSRRPGRRRAWTRDALGLVRELRDANGAVTVVGRHALGRWLAAAEQR